MKYPVGTFPALVQAWAEAFAALAIVALVLVAVVAVRYAYVSYRRTVRHERLSNGHWIPRS